MVIFMQKNNYGKKFEKEIESALKRAVNTSVDRLNDAMGGYAGVNNPSDYILYHYPHEFYIECKSFYGNTLNYKDKISQNQWDGMTEKSKIKGCIAGVCAWFMDYDLTVFVNIKDLNAHRESGAKSLNISNIVTANSIPHITLLGTKKRTMFTYDGEDFLINLHKLAKETWGE